MVDTDRIRAQFIELWGRMAGFWGISPSAARVFAHLFLDEDHGTSEELCESLAMSRGAVSMATRELREWGLAWPEKQPGSRQIRWRVEADFERAIRRIVETRKRREWDPILDHVHEWVDELQDAKGPEAVHVRRRLEKVCSVVSAVDEIAGRFLAGGVVEKVGLKLLVGGRRRGKKRARGDEA